MGPRAGRAAVNELMGTCRSSIYLLHSATQASLLLMSMVCRANALRFARRDRWEVVGQLCIGLTSGTELRRIVQVSISRSVEAETLGGRKCCGNSASCGLGIFLRCPVDPAM